MLARLRRRKRKEGNIHVLEEEQGADQGYDDGCVKRFLDAFWKNKKPRDAEMHAISPFQELKREVERVKAK
jgi:hypothetical protein